MGNSNNHTNYPELQSNRTDKLTALAKGILGACPYIGPITAEIIGFIIPNQRVDRIVHFINLLEEKVSHLSRELINQKMATEGFIDIFEESMVQAARALSDERRMHIASLVKNSICSADLKHIEDKKILYILSTLNDVELLILQSYGLNPIKQREFQEKHKDVFCTPIVHSGSPVDEKDYAAIHSTYKKHLEELGLLKPRFGLVKENLPEFDINTGMFKAKYYSISNLGSCLLRKLDLDCSY